MSRDYLHHHIVYLPDESCTGIVTHLGAYVSMVRFHVRGIEHEIMIPNEDLIFLEDISISLEEEEA
jgi:hypothetical protein